LARRLRAWWNGIEAPPEADGTPASATAAGVTADASAADFGGRKASAWQNPRLRVVERVFGTGFLGPNNEAWADLLIQPLNLDSKMTVLHLSAGLGGITRAIAKLSGAWVTGYESSPELAEAAMELSTLAGLGKRAPIQPYNPEAPGLKPKSCNAVVATKAFASVDNKAGLYDAVFAALRLDGHLMLTEYLRTGSNANAPAMLEWVKHEPRPVELSSVEETERELARVGFDVRVVEDVSKDLQRRIAASWAAFARTLAEAGLDRGLVSSLTDELSLWMARTNVLESGAVASYRIHAIKTRETAKG
jgi:cyclopropane fatty-acyl-phospholipid synthase-like methyltransferase